MVEGCPSVLRVSELFGCVVRGERNSNDDAHQHDDGSGDQFGFLSLYFSIRDLVPSMTTIITFRTMMAQNVISAHVVHGIVSNIAQARTRGAKTQLPRPRQRHR